MTTAMHGCPWPKALALLHQMPSRGLRADRVAIDCASSHSWRLSLSNPSEADQKTFGALMALAPWPNGCDLLEEMVRRRLRPNVITLNTLTALATWETSATLLRSFHQRQPAFNSRHRLSKKKEER